MSYDDPSGDELMAQDEAQEMQERDELESAYQRITELEAETASVLPENARLGARLIELEAALAEERQKREGLEKDNAALFAQFQNIKDKAEEIAKEYAAHDMEAMCALVESIQALQAESPPNDWIADGSEIDNPHYFSKVFRWECAKDIRAALRAAGIEPRVKV